MIRNGRTRGLAVLRALAGLLAFALALGLAAVVSALGTARIGLGGLAAKALPAAVLLVITVSLIALLRRYLDRQPLVGLGLRRGREALTGFAVVGGAAVLVFGVDAAAGGTRVSQVNVAALGGFLVVNTLFALALEAVPEELALRGYVFTALSDGWRPVIAAVGTTALFVVSPAVGIAIAAGLGRLLGLPTGPWTFAPSGQDPVSYAVLLTVFGAMLVIARISTGSLWTCIAAHLTFLTVNRIIVAPGFDTGVTVDLPPGGEVLVLVYLLVAAGAFLLVARLRRHRSVAATRPSLRRQRHQIGGV